MIWLTRNTHPSLWLVAILLLGAFVLASASTFPTARAQSGVTGVMAGGPASGVAYDPAKSEVFVTNFYNDTVTVLSDATNTVIATVSVGAGYNPSGIAYDSGKGEVFVADEGAGAVSVISDATNTVITTVSVGNQPNALVYDPSKGEVFVGNVADGTVSIISDANNSVVTTISSVYGADAVAYDSSVGEVFVTNLKGTTVTVISDTTDAVIATIGVGSAPDGIAYDSSKRELFVANGLANSVSVISDTTDKVVANVTVGNSPNGVAYDSAKGEVFVAQEGDGLVSVISDANNMVVATVSIGATPTAAAYDSAKGEVFATVGNDPTLTGATVFVISDSISTSTGQTTPTTSSTSITPTTTTSSKATVSCTTTPTQAPAATAPGIGGWAQANCYPTDISGQSCPIYEGYIYCVGGYTDSGPTSSVYFAQLSSRGVGTWTSTTDYPFAVWGESCNIVGGYIYCVGGTTGPTDASDIYFAPVSSAGVGAWVSNLGYGPSYPTTIYDQSCVTSGVEYGYIYCVGGFDGIRNSTSSALGTSSDVNYAQVTPNGVGDFSTPIVGSAGNYSFDYYPATVETQSCVASGGYIYCVGGFTVSRYNESAGLTFVPGLLNATYFAPISSAGEGAWARASSYPTTIFSQSCATSGGTIYCVGGDTVATGAGPTGAVNYAPITSAGVGAWVPSTSYPFSDEQQSCGISGGYIYCVGGLSNGASINAVCYAQINNSTSGSGTQAPSTCNAPRAASSGTSSASSTLSTASSSTASSSTPSSRLSLPLGYLGVVVIDAVVILAIFRLGFGSRPRRA